MISAIYNTPLATLFSGGKTSAEAAVSRSNCRATSPVTVNNRRVDMVVVVKRITRCSPLSFKRLHVGNQIKLDIIPDYWVQDPCIHACTDNSTTGLNPLLPPDAFSLICGSIFRNIGGLKPNPHQAGSGIVGSQILGII